MNKKWIEAEKDEENKSLRNLKTNKLATKDIGLIK